MISYSEDFRFLNKSMLNNELVVFVGAGVSMGSGLPSWNKLVEEIQNRLGITDTSFSDNTIIPQLYYNSRGKKDYNELIHELLYKPNAVPNDIHNCLVKINPRYIITTNYDNLIEQAFNESGIFLDVIEKDSNLPYAHTEHMLIKMHGGFKYDNYVLKEDDYLNYTNNFTLISSYIKALFARYTILFVGYSYNDPDTKQLFSWVRNILKDDQQRAYLINVTDDYDLQTYDYYKNMGMNVIYAKHLLGEKYNTTNLTYDTVSVLNEIIMPKYNVLSEIDNTLRGYDSFNYISGDYIQSVFNKYFTCALDDDCLSFLCYNEAEFSEAILYFDETDKEKTDNIQSKYPHILKIFRKSPIKRIIFIKIYAFFGDDKRKEYIISEHVTLDSIAHFEEFDYLTIKNTTIPYLSDIEDNYLQKAYCYYFLKDYISCYDLLRKAAKYYLSTNQLEMYFMTENNRIDVGKILSNNPFIHVTAVQKEKIKQELNAIKTYGLYANSYSAIKQNSPVSELIDFRYIYKNLYRIIEKGRKVDEEARTKYSIHTGKNAYESIESIVQDLYNYMQYNYLMLDVYSETKCIYTAFIEYILLSLSTKEESNDDGLFGSSYNIVLGNLSRFDILVILRFLSYKEIKSLTAKYKIDKIELNEEAIAYISKVITNLNKAFKNNRIPYHDISIFAKLFHLLKMSDLSQEILSVIYETIILLLEEFNDSIEYAELNSFIIKQYKDKKTSFKLSEIEKLILIICNTASHDDSANNNAKFMLILKNLISMLHEIEPSKTITISDKDRMLYSFALSDDALISIFSVSDKSFRKDIKKRLMQMFKQTNNVYTYYDALIHDIIPPIEKYENMLFKVTNDNIDNGRDNIIYCANLLIGKKIIDKDKFFNLIKRDKSLSLVIDPENFDYDQFDTSLLSSLTNKSLEIISSSEKAYDYIHIELKKYLSKNWDERLIRIYINYFSK